MFSGVLLWTELKHEVEQQLLTRKRLFQLLQETVVLWEKAVVQLCLTK